MSITRVGLMGGTFDPIHIGHLVCADEAIARFDLDVVIFIPAGAPWQKPTSTDAEDRYMMTMLSTASDPRLSVSRIEIDRPGPTYTIDTLETMSDFFGSDALLFFIIGADAVVDILTWSRPDEVLAKATFIAATRPGHSLADLDDARTFRHRRQS
ncbi:MAG: nicotinate-nucleotide adenylyltransferase [Actinobacteria bacterium]|nr:nicotinate-nucleotide adenylyltransferase [Actinomycetota bacterium]